MAKLQDLAAEKEAEAMALQLAKESLTKDVAKLKGEMSKQSGVFVYACACV